MKRLTWRNVAAPVLAGALLVGVGAAHARDLGVLQLRGALVFTEQGSTAASCPPGAPDSTACYPTTGSGIVPGLGAASEAFTRVVDDAETSCGRAHFTAVLTIAGKGQVDIAAADPGCVDAATRSMTFDFTVAGGTGAYTGAGGTGTIVRSYRSDNTGSDTWSGTLTVPGLDFDTVPPTIAGATNRLVRTKSTGRVRVNYAPTASDSTDGTVPVTCRPPSGSRFPVGRTPVTCTAVDAGGNSTTARFTVTVRRVRR